MRYVILISALLLSGSAMAWPDDPLMSDPSSIEAPRRYEEPPPYQDRTIHLYEQSGGWIGGYEGNRNLVCHSDGMGGQSCD